MSRRMRCYYDDCDQWATTAVWTPTEWSVMAKVPVCTEHGKESKQYYEFGRQSGHGEWKEVSE